MTPFARCGMHIYSCCYEVHTSWGKIGGTSAPVARLSEKKSLEQTMCESDVQRFELWSLEYLGHIFIVNDCV